ncbi:MAG: hypothetical protein HUJ63_11775 [Enterococcus sp.]|nr:hypothetical protein [Enterococcus sp.]
MKRKVWVLTRRYEWDDQGGQTESVDVHVFEDRKSAVEAAKRMLFSDMKNYGYRGTRQFKAYVAALESRFRKSGTFLDHELSDGDNVVYELYRRTVRKETSA